MWEQGVTVTQTTVYESYEEAIRDTVTALGGFKKVGSMLWPAMPADEAGRKLSACLNTEKREKLDLGELRLIRHTARAQGIHALMFYEARDAGYAEPTPVTPEDEAAQLMREYIEAVKRMDAIQSRMKIPGVN